MVVLNALTASGGDEPVAEGGGGGIASRGGLIVLTLTGDRISVITGFTDNSVLPRFGLPRTLHD